MMYQPLRSIVLLWQIIYWTYTVKDSSSVNATALDVLVLLLVLLELELLGCAYN